MWLNAFADRLELYFSKDAELYKLLLEVKAVSERCGAPLPYAVETLLCTQETLGNRGDITLALAKRFTANASENLKDIYIRNYGMRLLGLCSTDMDVETISASVWLAVVASDRDNFKKLLKGASRLSSSSIRILLGRVADALIIAEDPDKVEEMIVSLSGKMKLSDYLSFKNKTLSKYSWEEYGNIFFLAEEKFGFFAKKRLEKQK